MAIAHRVFVTLDCDDPEALAAFWSAMLDGEVAFSTERAIAVKTDALFIAAMRVDDYRPPTWPEADVPKQIHLDLAVTDLEAAVAEAERHGARAAAEQPASERHRVMLDPAGHPFCLTTATPRDL